MSVDEATIALFLDNAAKSAAVTHRAAGEEELRSILSEIIAGDADVFCPRVTELEKTAVEGRARLVPEYATARVTVEEVSAAIAETGSIVCASSGGKAVQASLLPSQHVAIVPRDRIFATLDDFFAGQCRSAPHQPHDHHRTQPHRRHRAQPGNRGTRPGTARYHRDLRWEAQ